MHAIQGKRVDTIYVLVGSIKQCEATAVDILCTFLEDFKSSYANLFRLFDSLVAATAKSAT